MTVYPQADHRDVTRDMWSLKCIRKYLSRESTEMLVHAFITSRVDYCNSLLYGLPNYQLHKLQRVLNASARLVCNVPRFCHISPLLRSLHWLPVKARIQNRYCLLRSKQFTALFLDIYASYYTCQVSRLQIENLDLMPVFRFVTPGRNVWAITALTDTFWKIY